MSNNISSDILRPSLTNVPVPGEKTVLEKYGMTRSDIAYKYYTKKYGRSGRIRVWNSATAAKKDFNAMRIKGYKVKLTPDNKAVVILGKTTRGVARTRAGRRAMVSQTMRQPGKTPLPRAKPYGPSHATFRQPSRTLQKMGWSR